MKKVFFSLCPLSASLAAGHGPGPAISRLCPVGTRDLIPGIDG